GRYAAFEFVPGHRASHEILRSPRGRRRAVHDAGRALGLLHTALADLELAHRPSAGLDARGKRLVPAASSVDALRAVGPMHGFDPALRLHALDDELAATSLESGIIHGDYGPYNILVRPGRPLLVIDFELARTDWLLIDLA